MAKSFKLVNDKRRRMRTKRRNRWRVGGILLFFVLLQLLFNPFSSLQHAGNRLQARLYLPSARQKWDAQGIHHYRFDIRGSVPLVCIFGGGIEVRDGVVIPVVPSNAGESGAMLYASFPEIEAPPLCNVQNYTMSGLFNLVETWQAESPSSITQISFDRQYRFISSFSFGNPGGSGLLSPTVSDCCGFFVIENFQILDD
jgi:hypothetical protein